jgi:hypothetical protein
MSVNDESATGNVSDRDRRPLQAAAPPPPTAATRPRRLQEYDPRICGDSALESSRPSGFDRSRSHSHQSQRGGHQYVKYHRDGEARAGVVRTLWQSRTETRDAAATDTMNVAKQQCTTDAESRGPRAGHGVIQRVIGKSPHDRLPRRRASGRIRVQRGMAAWLQPRVVRRRGFAKSRAHAA